jgi:micrococcal nuclease
MNRSVGIAGILLMSLMLAATPARGLSCWSGACVGVADGDTIHVMHGERAEKIRLYAVDAPERGQDFGNKARQFTSDLVFGKVVEVTPMDRDQYGRTVAWVTVDGKNVSHELIRAGLAWWYRLHAPKEKELRRLEEEARNAKRGLWSMNAPIPPWQWRKDRKQAH